MCMWVCGVQACSSHQTHLLSKMVHSRNSFTVPCCVCKLSTGLLYCGGPGSCQITGLGSWGDRRYVAIMEWMLPPWSLRQFGSWLKANSLHIQFSLTYPTCGLPGDLWWQLPGLGSTSIQFPTKLRKWICFLISNDAWLCLRLALWMALLVQVHKHACSCLHSGFELIWNK